MCASIFAGLWLVHVCLCTLKGRPVETRQKVARLREHNNNNLKYKLPVERKPPEPEPEPESTAATTETRTNVKIRKLCSPDMLSDSRTAPRFCVRINKVNINSANVTPRRALVRKLENFTGIRRYRPVKCLVVLRKCVVSERPFYFRPIDLRKLRNRFVLTTEFICTTRACASDMRKTDFNWSYQSSKPAWKVSSG